MNPLPNFDGAYLAFQTAHEARVRLARNTAQNMRYTPATGQLEILRSPEMVALDAKLARICGTYLAGVGCLCSAEPDALTRADAMFAETLRLSIESMPPHIFTTTPEPSP